MPNQHVPPDSGMEETPEPITPFDPARIQSLSDTLRHFAEQMRDVRITPEAFDQRVMYRYQDNPPRHAHIRITPDNAAPMVWDDELILDEITTPVPMPTPEPQPEPVPDRFPRETVWIMQTPTRRGPGRVSAITRSARWNSAYERVSVYGRLPDDTPRHSNGFTRPDRLTGSTHSYRWWFLGWHSNGHPMFAVRMTFRIDDEGEIRRAIRERISHAVTRLNCHFCYSSYPVSEEWPIPRGHAASLYLTGYGTLAVCSACSSNWLTCAQPGCRERGRVGDMVRVRTNAVGTETADYCQSHAATVARCIHCNGRFASASVHHDHNCTGSDLDWERCSVCANQSRVWTLVTYTDGTRQPVCSDPMRRCMRGIRQCHLCQGYSRSTIVMGHGASMAPDYPICAECAERHDVTDCEHCGYNYPAVDSHDCHSGGRCCCDLCCGRVIRSYSYKPKARFQGRDRYGLFLGMELEIFVDRNRDVHDVARAVQSDLGRVGYIKSDGSISHGFEIVTHPMSYEYAMSEFPWQVLRTLDDRGSFATEGSGIHIHASRKGFSGPSHEYRWMIFLHRNQRQAQVIARRISNQWASFSSDQRRIAKDIATKKLRDSNRYRAINQTNSETIEIRIFESSTDEQTVRATIGFVHASIEYARVIRSRDVLHDDAWGWKAFAKWVKARPEYAALYAEMERLNVAGDTDAQPSYSDPRNGTPGRTARTRESLPCECDPDLDGCGCRCDGDSSCRGNCICRECDGECYDDSDNDEDW